MKIYLFHFGLCIISTSFPSCVPSHLVVGGDHPHWQSVGVPANAKRVSAAVRHGCQVLLVAEVTRRRHTASQQTDGAGYYTGNWEHKPVAKVVLEVPGDQRHGELVGAIGIEDVELLGGRRRHLKGGGT